MIKKGKKRITITLDEDTLEKSNRWNLSSPSWSYWINIALSDLMYTFEQQVKNNGIEPKTKKYKIILKEIKDDQ